MTIQIYCVSLETKVRIFSEGRRIEKIMEKKKIGELLIESGYATAEQVAEALEVQKTKSERICNILIDLGYLSEEGFLEFLGTRPGIASVELARCEIDSEILDLIPRELAIQLEAVPIGKIRNLLTLAMVCPLDEAGRIKLEDVTGLRIKPVLCSRGAVYNALERYYKSPEEAEFVQERAADISELQASLKLRRVATLTEQIEELPTLPEITTAISAIATDPDSSASDLAKVIATDAALSAKILKLANSAAFGFSREISSIQHAVALLGFKATHALALSISIFDSLIDKADFDFKAHWNHSYACATLTKLISLHLPSCETEVAFVAGLLHDVGKVVLAMNMHRKQEEATLLHSTSAISAIEAEEKVLGITHAEVGYLLGEHWLLPTTLTNAIRYHHSPELEPEPKGLGSVVFLANLFCDRATPQIDENSAFDAKAREVMETLGIPDGVFARMIETYSDTVSEITIF